MSDVEAKTPKSGFTHRKLEELKDDAPDFGFEEFQEARFANDELELTQAGLSFHRLKPGKRQPFGHHHDESEEVYVVIGGSGRAMIGDELVELEKYDAIRIAPGLTRAFEAGDDGLEIIASGQHLEEDQGEVVNGWWGD